MPKRQKTKRVTLTKLEKAQKILDQKGRCGCGCDEKLVTGNVSFDHKIPVWKRKTRKWSKQDEYNGQIALCEDPCHKRKTKKEAGERAHYLRLEKEHNGLPKRKRVKAKMQSPGFSKTHQRKMNGSTVRIEK